MNPRRKKLQKIIELREKTLDECKLALKATQDAQRQAEALAEEQRRQVLAAEEHRAGLTRGVVSLDAWVQGEQWLSSRRTSLELAKVAVARADHGVSAARVSVLDARTGVRRIEVLEERLKTQELKRETRLEQRFLDELSARQVEALTRRSAERVSRG